MMGDQEPQLPPGDSPPDDSVTAADGLGFGDLAEAAARNEALPPTLPPVACWRCGKLAAANSSRCPVCGAAFQPAADEHAAPNVVARPVVRLLIGYSVLLAFSVMAGLYVAIAATAGEHESQRTPSLFEITTPEVVLECIWTIAIIIICCCVPRVAADGARPRVGWARFATSSIVCVPLLGGMLWLNYEYHSLLTKFIDFHWLFQTDEIKPPTQTALIYAVIAICLQPGVFEELFFRHVALGTLRGFMGVPAAIAISSAMFGLAHIYAPLSVPYLTLMGVFLGVARVWSGGLLLPIVLHAMHNGGVLWMELQRTTTAT